MNYADEKIDYDVKFAERKKEIPRAMFNKALGRKLKVLEYEEYIRLSLQPRFSIYNSKEFLDMVSAENQFEVLDNINRGLNNICSQLENLEMDIKMLKNIITYITGDKDVSRIVSHYSPIMAKTFARLVHGLAKARPIDY